jgi:hypothetical protein
MFRCPGYRPLGWWATGPGFEARCRYHTHHARHPGGGLCFHPDLTLLWECPYPGGTPGPLRRLWGGIREAFRR